MQTPCVQPSRYQQSVVFFFGTLCSVQVRLSDPVLFCLFLSALLTFNQTPQSSAQNQTFFLFSTSSDTNIRRSHGGTGGGHTAA
jgi:hypothetical protein